jgi:hypothetical protein
MTPLRTAVLDWIRSKYKGDVKHTRPPKPGEPDSYFTYTPDENTEGGKRLGMLNFKVVKNQNECVLYAGNHVAVDVRIREVSPWVEAQDISMWKYAEEDDGCHVSYTRYIMSDELYTLLVLRWT